MANKIYVNQEAAITWTDDTTGGDYTLDIGGLATVSVRAGDVGDLGSGARADRYYWKFIVDGFDTAPVVGQVVSIYLAFSMGGTQADTDGDLSGTDGASSTVVLPNLLHLGDAVVQTTTAADELVVSGVVEILARYVVPVVYNQTDDALLSTSDAHKFILYPAPPEVQ